MSEGAHACALEGKCRGAHVRTRMSTRVRAYEDAHVRIIMCVRKRLPVRAVVGARVCV